MAAAHLMERDLWAAVGETRKLADLAALRISERRLGNLVAADLPWAARGPFRRWRQSSSGSGAGLQMG
jgi:hypothetical protein